MPSKKNQSRFIEVDQSQMLDGNYAMSMLDSMAQRSAPPAKEAGFARGLGDVALSFGQGATGAFKAVSDVFGAENPVSRGLGGMSEYMQGLKSDASKAELAASQARIQQAEESGSTMDQVGAYLNMLWDQPAEMIAQGAGSFATLGLGKLAQAAKLAQGAKAAGMTKQAFLATDAGIAAAKAAADLAFKTNVGVGVAQGMGAVKGSQYEQTYRNAVQQGMSPEQAAALADEAQAYGGAGTMQQLLGAGLGGLATATGPIERLIAGKAAGQPAASMLGAAGKGFMVESGTEGLQGAQERYAGNDAAIDAGVLAPERRWTGVAGQGVQEGAIGGLLGAGGGAMEPRSPQAAAPAPAPIVPESGPLTKAVNAGAAVTPPAPAPVPVTPEQEQALLAHANKRFRELEEKANGTKDQKVTGLDGKPVTVPGKQPEFLTPAEKEEREFLAANGGDAQALARAYKIPDPPAPTATEQTGNLAGLQADAAETAPAQSGNLAELESQPADPAPATPTEPQGPAFASLDEADDYVTAQMKRGGGVSGVPVQNEDGSIALVDKKDPRYTQAQLERQARKKARAQAAKTKEPVNDPAGDAAQPGATDAGAVPGAAILGGEPVALGADRGTDAPVADGTVPAGNGAAGAGRGNGNDALTPSMLAAGAKAKPQPTTLGAQPIQAQPAGTRGTTAADIIKKAPPAEQKVQPAAQIPQEQAPAEQKAQAPAADPAATWNSASEQERADIMMASGWLSPKSKPVQRASKMAWDKLSEPQRAKIAKGLSQRSANAQAAPEGAGTPAKEAPADQTRAAEGADAARAEQQPVDAGARGAEVEADGVEQAADAAWWNSLTPFGRRQVIEAAGLKLPDAVTWNNLTAANRKKLAARKDVVQVDAADAAPAPAPASKAEMRPYRRPDGSIGYEAVPIREPEAPAPAPSANTVFTEDAAEKARAILRAKLGGGNKQRGGIDPEVFTAGLTLAGYHIEKGARKFAAYARAMVDDLGDVVKPYLKSWYMGVKYDPRGASLEGMDSAADVEAADVDAILDGSDTAGVAPATKQDNNSPKEGSTDEQVRQPNLGAQDQAAGRQTEGRREPSAQQEDARRDPEELGAEQSQDVGSADAGQAGGRPGDGGAGSNVGSQQGAARGGDAGDGRPRNGRTRASDAGAGSRSGKRPAGKPAPVDPETVSPANPGPGDFVMADPLKVVGGGQVARFEKNKAAIELRNRLMDEGRAPTREEQEVLAGYTGWGSFGQELFQGTWGRAVPKAGWEARDQWLREHLGQSEWEGMQTSIINAHYTDPPTVMAMWDMVKRLGFQGGRVLEPSIGIGNFFAMMPADLTARSQRAGIELDPMTGSMAQLLYPSANIQIKGYEQSTTPDNFYDLVIGNWPFSEVSPADRRYNRLSPTLHDYFFLKALDQVKPGGIVIGITTKGTMDKKGVNARMEMARKAELVAAFRLPTGAFEEYAGTKVVTDIIILKKREKPLSVLGDEGWIEVKDHDTREGTKVPVNEYFHRNPSHVIGQIDFGHGTTTFRPGLIVHRPADMMEQLRRIVGLVPEGVFSAGQQTKQISYVANHTSDRTNALVKNDKGFFVVQGEYLAPADEVLSYKVKSDATTKQREAQLSGLIDLRRLYGLLIDAERQGDATTQRKALSDAYEAFKLQFGPLTKSWGLGYLERIDDPFYPSLAALEVPGVEDGKTILRPAAILRESTIRGARTIDKPSVSDAFVLARNEAVNPSLDRIAELANKPAETVKSDLIESGAIFELPNGDIEPSDLYLSGNVRAKLRDAQAALEAGNAAMERNVKALQEVVPADVPYYKIETQMGATWVPGKVYADYIAHMLAMPKPDGITVEFKNGAWHIDMDTKLNGRAEANSGFGTNHVRFKRLVRAAIANQSITVKFKDRDGKEHVDDEATKEVSAKIADMRTRFGEWLWKDPQRRSHLEREYNEVRNAYATPKFDGSFLNFQGMALSLGRGPFSLRQHQVNAIWRALVSRKSLNAHEVGTGKTFTMGGIAVESRRYGIAKKPMLFAHNANSKSVAHEIQMMYPAAKVLYLDNLSKDSIKIRLMQIANDDWDVVVLPHSLIDRIGFKRETLEAMAKEEILSLEIAAEEAAAEDGVTIESDMWDDEQMLNRLRSPTAKQLVKQRMQIRAEIDKLAQQASREGAVAFEDLGVDMILVDEAHEFKKPPIATKMKMKGLQTQTSNRSIAMMFLTRYVRSMNGGGNVHLFTGTPITNTMTEVFHMMRYMMMEEMDAQAVGDFDGWFGSFAREVSDVELTPTGEYEAVTRLQSFINVPELRRMIGQYMDVVFAEDMPEMQPRQVNGKRLTDKNLTEADRAEILNGRTENAADRPYKKVVNESADMSPDQQRVFEQVRAWANAWRNMPKKARKEAMLSGAPESPIIHEGIAARASFDVRLVDARANAGKEGTPEMEPHADSKPARVVAKLVEIYKSHKSANQVVFMEQGLSSTVTRREGPAGNKRNVTYPAFSTVKDMIERLVQKGIPREQIAVVDGSTSKDKRKEIADAMNEGRIRIVFGSSDSLGVGVNMQRNLRAMHHMDAPWMPGELEQRNGRGHRQGNQWNTVMEYRYLTDRLDGRRWQVLAIKQKFITDFMKSKGDARVIEGDAASEDGGDILATLSEAAGDPRILLKEKAKKKLGQLQSRERIHSKGISDALDEKERSIKRAHDARAALEKLQKSGLVEKLNNLMAAQAGEGFRMEAFGRKFDGRQEAADAVPDLLKSHLRMGMAMQPVGKYGDMELLAAWSPFSNAPHFGLNLDGVLIESNGPSLRSLEAQIRSKADNAEKDIQDRIAGYERAIAQADRVAAEPFHLADNLKKAKDDLAALERDIAMNPVAPPHWLRAGAPVDTDVVWGGNTMTVTGHRWSPDGWFVLAKDGKGEASIPYMEVRDSQGMPLYEEHEFSAPQVLGTRQGQAAADPGEARFSRRSTGRGGVPMQDAESAADLIRREFPGGPQLNLLESVDDAPAELRKQIIDRGAQNDVEAVYWDGQIYAFPGHFIDMDRFMFVVGRHEVLHAGFDAMLGQDKDAILMSIGRANRRVALEARKLMDDGFAASFAEGVEEALADMTAEDVAALSRIKLAVAAIRRWLRATAFKLRKAGWRALADAIEPRTWSDNDVIAFVKRAEDVSRGPGGGGGARFSRSGDVQERTLVATNEDGLPEFQYGGTKLAFPIPSDRMEVIPVAGQQVLHYAIMPSDSFDVLGHVELLLENGRPVSLLDIEAYSKGGGVGRQTVETLLRALGGQSLNISNIVPAAQTFWERMGVPTQNLEEGAAYDGNIDLETFLQAQDGQGARAGSRSAGGQGRSADAGAEAGAPGPTQGRKAGRLSRASRQPLETVRDAAFRSGEAVKELNLLAGYKVGDFLESTGKLSWWDKTVGTPYNLAKRHPGTFGRVYDAVQGFLSDVSFYAAEAANMAPTLLPKLESIKDLARTAIKPADNKAIAAPIFEGTLAWLRDSSGKPIRLEDAEAAAAKLSVDDKAHKLMREKRIAPEVIRMWQGRPVDQYEKMVEARYAAEFLKPGVVWTDAELRQRFGLADGQIGLYKEARAAINRSLDDLTQSELTRMVRLDLGAVAPEPGQSVDEFAVALRDRLYEMGADDTADRVIQVANRLKDLKDRGYAPLSRFGHYTLDVIHEDERVWFGLYESQAEANKAARKMAETFPGATITQGTQSQEAYKLFAGITPETIELFGDILGLDAEGDSASDKAFQEYLKRATASRSAMKRMIHRKGTAGFSEEVGRVLAGFVTSNARRTARNHAQASITQALNEIPKEQGELKDYAIKMADYVNNPVEEAQAFRGLLFAQYLGGSVASAIVNMTQPIAVGVPYLSQFGGARKAAAAMTKAMADMAGQKKLEPSLAAAIARAEEEGIVAPQEIYQLQAQASGQGGLRSGDGTVAGNALATASNAMTKASLVWGKLFSLAELVNRRSMFIAAYRVAVSNGHPNPEKFAADAVVETQFTYNKGNRPEWARGAIGAVLFTFKTYSISYVELMARMWKLGGPDGKKAFWLGVAVLLLMGGADELPFMEDAEDVIDGVMQGVMGKNWQTKARRREFLADALGEDLARFVSRGISGLPGVPLDVSGRLGMGNLIPGTGLLRQDQSSTGRDWAEIAGPGADLIQRGFKAVGLAGQGELARAGTELLPVAARNALKAKDMADTGMYRDPTGKKVIDTTAGEAILKGIGFQPNSVARVQEASGLKQRMIALNKQTETEIADMWALGRFEGDPAKVERARNRLKDWNQQNPDSLIRIEQSQINKRVQKMRQSKAERLAATAPKEIRADVRRDLEAAK